MTNRLCLEDSKEDHIFTASCLKERGHEGGHKHSYFCNSPNCMCLAVFNRMAKEDYEEYKQLAKKQREIRQKENEILDKYMRKD